MSLQLPVPLAACAAEFGLFSYAVIGDEVKITGYPADATGDVVIPGNPFSSIQELPRVFHNPGATGYRSGFWAPFSPRQYRDDPKIDSIEIVPGGRKLEVVPFGFNDIGVEYSPDLSEGSWIELGNFFEQDGVYLFIDTDAFRTASGRGYYRAFSR